jgi:hypothetical protein
MFLDPKGDKYALQLLNWKKQHLKKYYTSLFCQGKDVKINESMK